MKSMATNNGTILQFVYYYPPINSIISYSNILTMLSEGVVIGEALKQFSSNAGLSYYNISYAQPSPFGVPEVSFVAGFIGQQNTYVSLLNSGSYTIFMTPQAYVSWYNDSGIQGLILSNPQYKNTNYYLETLYNYCNSTPSNPLSTIENNTIVFSKEINEWYYTLQELNIKFIPYNSNYAEDGLSLSSVAIDPVKTYGLTSNELYMMVIPSATISTSTSSSITNPTNYYNHDVGIEAEEASFIDEQSTEYTTQLNQSTGASKVATDINNIPNDISKALTGPDGWIYWLGIGIIGIVGVLAIAMALKK